MAVNQVATLGVKVDPRKAVTGASRAKRAIAGIGRTARNVKSNILSMQGALIGLGAGAVLKSIITTASSVESLRVRLKFLTGSTEDAAKAFEVMNEFAKRVPFSLEDIEKASPLLLTVANDVDELNELLEITGDIAAVSGLSFDKTAEQLQRAMASGISSADLFRERGVAAFLGFEAGVSKTGKETAKIIKTMFREGTTTAKGATEELKDTFQGQVSMMQDAWRELKLVIADSGVFEDASIVVQKLTTVLKDPKTLENMQKFGEGISTIARAMGRMTEKLLALPPWVLEVGLIMAFLGGKKAKFVLLGLIAISETIDAITNSVKNMKTAMEDYGGPSADFSEFATEKGLAQIKEQQRIIAEMDRVIDKHFFTEKQAFTMDRFDGGEINEAVVTLGNNIGNLSHLAHQNMSAIDIMALKYKEVANIVADEVNPKLQEFADSLADNIEDSIMRMTQGLMSFKDVVKSVFKFVAMEMVRNNIAKPLAGALASIFSGSAVGSFTAGLGLPEFANGGRPQVGQPSIVGERGAELFVPDSAGTIVPSGGLGGQTINITYAPQVNALDHRTAQMVISENAPTIVNVIRQAFNQNGQQVAI